MATITTAAITTPQSAANMAISAIGCGFDLSNDVRLQWCKQGSDGSPFIELNGGGSRDLFVPGGIVVPYVPWSIRCDKGERTRFRSDVLSFHQMSEHFNQNLSLSGKIPSGLFNAMFDFRNCWQKDAHGTKNLAYDGCYLTLYSVELVRFEMVLHDSVKQDVPTTWDPAALTTFIKKYGTHIITGVKMGGKDVIHLKQTHSSSLLPNEMQNLIKKIADRTFSEDTNGSIISDLNGLQRQLKENHGLVTKSIGSSIVSHSKKKDIISIHVRRGGINYNQSHKHWLSTIPLAPDVVSMSFVPITSLLNGVPGSGFLSHAINHYLRYKPPVEELHQFLEFQLPRQWAPAFGDLPLGCMHRKQRFPSLRFSLMGPKLCVNTDQVGSGNHPVTGIRLYLEGLKSDCLAIHLQHLSTLPDTLHITEDGSYNPHNDEMISKDYYEPIRWSLFSHVCTAPIQYNVTRIDDSASIVTKVWLEVKGIGVKKVLFLRLGFSSVASAKIRRSEWDGPFSISRKSVTLSGLVKTKFTSGHILPPIQSKVELNSALFPGGPPVPLRVLKMSKFIDTSETTRGPEDLPGYWVVTGAKLCMADGKILVRAKYSLLTILSKDGKSELE